jgi:glutamate/aspartate transport system substrate-binding protein
MPFSYFDRTRNVVGYSIDICRKVIEAIKADLRKPDLKVEMRPIKPEDAGSYVVSGVIDMHCGPIQNTWQRKSQVDFGMTYFVRRYRFASHESSHMDEMTDVHGRTLATLYGSATTALQTFAAAHNLQPKVIPARSVGDAFEMFRNGGADAVLVDEISLAEGVARFQPQDPAMVFLSNGSFGAEAYSLVFMRGDPPFKKLVSDTLRKLYTSKDVHAIYGKWFTSPIPPDRLNLNLPVSEPLRKAFQQPTDSPDPASYE